MFVKIDTTNKKELSVVNKSSIKLWSRTRRW